MNYVRSPGEVIHGPEVDRRRLPFILRNFPYPRCQLAGAKLRNPADVRVLSFPDDHPKPRATVRRGSRLNSSEGVAT